ncbi:transketolase [Candidatus Aerophobetes bacterium]|nr:transketolase [Candidatus Aerophobetes bacterium]
MNQLQKRAKEFRKKIIEMIYIAQSGHPGGSLSAIDIITVLYFHHMRIDPSNPLWEDRDRFILSKGHSVPALYVVLAELGYFPEKELYSLRNINSILQGHPDMRKTPGVEMSTGSLGHGLSVGVGIAISGKLKKKDFYVYVLLGDGELDEGSVWEAAISANKYSLDNLIAICDFNKVQLDGPVDEIMPLNPLRQKWEAFGWNTIEIDGHNILEIANALDFAKEKRKGPTIIIAHTIKGKGVSYMEGKFQWHGGAPNQKQYELALKELEGEK